MPDEKKPVVTEMMTRPIRFWAQELRAPDWLFAALKAGRHLDDESKLSRADFESALSETAALRIKGT